VLLLVSETPPIPITFCVWAIDVRYALVFRRVDGTFGTLWWDGLERAFGSGSGEYSTEAYGCLGAGLTGGGDLNHGTEYARVVLVET